jgi:molybdopterin converting factor small subunit
MSVEVNEQILTFPGEMGSMAEIQVNSQPASLETKISGGDKIAYTPAKGGADARVSVAMLLNRFSPFCVTLEGREYGLKPPVYRGEQNLDEAVELADRDRLRVLKTMSLSWVLAQLGLGHEPGSIIRVRVNDNEKQIPYGPRVYLVNGTAAVPETDVTDGDAIDSRNDGDYPTIACLTEARRQEIEFSVNGRTLVLPVKEVSYEKNGRKATLDTPLEEGDSVEITETCHEVTMANILNLIDFDTTPPVGQNRLILRVNGRDVQFTTVVLHGDRIEVGWSS